MHVQRVAMPASRTEAWTVLDGDGVPVEPVERFLTYLTDIERSPNTVRAYAHDLKDWFTFLAGRGLDWREMRLEDVGEFVAWLRRPPQARGGCVGVLPSVEQHCTESTVNRKLSAVSAFYAHAARHGVDVGELLTTWQLPGRRGSGWKPFLHHVRKSKPQPRRAIALRAPKKLPRVLTAAEVQVILDACERLRDRFLFAVLYDTGMRVGEALGLRHADIAAAEREVTVCPRVNLHGEYGDLDSDYVFVNLFAEPRGQALSYPAVYELVRRLRRATGIDFDPHWWRQTAATRLLREGVPLEVVSTLLGHAHITTTVAIYGHLTAEDARRVLEQAGWFTGREVQW